MFVILFEYSCEEMSRAKELVYLVLFVRENFVNYGGKVHLIKSGAILVRTASRYGATQMSIDL